MFGLELGFFGLIILIAVVYAIVKTVQSAASTGVKVVWIVAILIFPLFGFLAWLLFGPRS
ncbi:MAG: PLDc N-terminal domain-containing protein [Rhodospirillales bacterium]|nr:PLDc N-terminal domain-containing protein [Rhodospirillales bacterium]